MGKELKIDKDTGAGLPHPFFTPPGTGRSARALVASSEARRSLGAQLRPQAGHCLPHGASPATFVAMPR